MSDENVSTTIPREQWDKMTKEQQDLLTGLGMKPERIKKKVNQLTLERRLSTRDTCPEEYYVKIFKTCGCCHTKTTGIGRMTQLEKTNFLTFVEGAIPEGEIFRQLAVTHITCHDCTEVLSAIEHSKLVEMYKLMHNKKGG